MNEGFEKTVGYHFSIKKLKKALTGFSIRTTVTIRVRKLTIIAIL